MLDGQREIFTDLTLAAFGNTRSYGGGMRICPDARHDDGLLDVTMVHTASRLKLIRLFPTVFRAPTSTSTRVTTARAAPSPWSPRNQRLRRRRLRLPPPAEISAVPRALEILTP